MKTFKNLKKCHIQAICLKVVRKFEEKKKTEKCVKAKTVKAFGKIATIKKVFLAISLKNNRLKVSYPKQRNH